MRSKYPDTPVKIVIEQDGNTVRMIIETSEGSKDKIEECLDKYSLVVAGKMNPESLFYDPVDILELRNELRIAKARIEMQK